MIVVKPISRDNDLILDRCALLNSIRKTWQQFWGTLTRKHLRNSVNKWAVSSEFGTYRLCEQRRFRQAYASVQSRQNLRCSLIQAVSQEEPSDRKPDPWPLRMAGRAQLKFVMTECSKTQIRLRWPKFQWVLENCTYNHIWSSKVGVWSVLNLI